MKGIPIVLLFLICLFIIFILLLRRISLFQRTHTRSKSVYVQLSVYVSVLLLSFILHFFLPFHSLEKRGDHGGYYAIPSLYAMVYEGNLREEAWDYQVMKEEFTIEDIDHPLILQSSYADDPTNSIHVLLEEAPSLTDTFVASVYQTPSYFDGFELTKDIDPFDLKMYGNVLRIHDRHQLLKYAAFTREFFIKQFQKEPKRMFEEDSFMGEQIVYLQVPSNLTVDISDDHILLYDVE